MIESPPYRITSRILQLMEGINRKLGAIDISGLPSVGVRLRKENRVKTIHASLAIEGNTLTLDQVSDVLEGKRVIGPEKDILEAENATLVYHDLGVWDALDEASLLKAHAMLMGGLTSGNGSWRTGAVGVFQGDRVAHMAPPAARVSELMGDLFAYLRESEDPWMIKACAFHYELEFIHPFSDGNGRMGRLWQQLLLMQDSAVFEYVPVEALIREHQQGYYAVLQSCDVQADCTLFIEFSLDKVLEALDTLPQGRARLMPQDRLSLARRHFKGKSFCRKEYAALFNISSATASRDLLQGVKSGLLGKEGERAQTVYNYQAK